MKKKYMQRIIIGMCVVLNMYAHSMSIYEYFPKLYLKERIITEYFAYQLLKQNPIKKSVNCLMVPWVNLIRKKRLDQMPDIKLNGGFTICQHVKYKEILPILRRIGIDILFTPHAQSNEEYYGVKILPFPHYPAHGVGPAPEKDIYYSFIGYRTHKVRQQIFNMDHPDNCVIIKRKNWHWWVDLETQKLEKNEYQNVLARSRFLLCPVGVGPSTPRFWESLQAGAIPIIIADNFVLPDWVNWDSCTIRIFENEVNTIPQVLAQISSEQEQIMRQKCLEVFALFSHENFVSTIRHYYNDVE